MASLKCNNTRLSDKKPGTECTLEVVKGDEKMRGKAQKLAPNAGVWFEKGKAANQLYYFGYPGFLFLDILGNLTT